MNKKQVLQSLSDQGIGFRLEDGGSKVVITHTTAAFKPYQLQRINLIDFYKKHLVTRTKKPLNIPVRVYPTDIGEYADFLQERCRTSMDALEERQRERREYRLESIKEVEEKARELWSYDPDDDADAKEVKQEYEARLDFLRKKLP